MQMPYIKPYADFSFIPNKVGELVGVIHLLYVRHSEDKQVHEAVHT